MKEEVRIEKLRKYLSEVLNRLVEENKININADMLSKNINSYSLDKIPTASTVERWINGIEIHRDVFSFKSRLAYSQDTINNLSNISFFEEFENIISSNNKNCLLTKKTSNHIILWLLVFCM